MTFYIVISVLFVGSCFNALDCADLMSRHVVRCGSNKCGWMSTDNILRFLQLILSCTLFIRNILSFKDAS